MVLAAVLLLSLPVHIALGDDTPIVTPEATLDAVTTPTAVPETPVATTVIETPTVAPAPTLTEEAQITTPEPTVEMTVETTPADEGTPAVVDSTPEPTATPQATVRYAPARDVACKVADGVPEIIASGGTLDYTCRYQATFQTDAIDPSTINLLWTVQAAGGTWTVQLKPPATVANPNPTWSDPLLTPVKMQHQTRPAGTPGTTATQTTQTLEFSLRLTRTACSMVLPPIFVVADVVPSVDGAVIERVPPPPVVDPYRLMPALAEVGKPEISFAGSLDFGAVSVDANGVLTPPEPKTISVTVSNLQQSCGSWRLDLSSTSLGGENGTTIESDTLVLVGIDGVAIDGALCSLSTGCVIGTAPGGPDQPDTVTFALALTLELPEQMAVTTFNSTLTASITQESS